MLFSIRVALAYMSKRCSKYYKISILHCFMLLTFSLPSHSADTITLATRPDTPPYIYNNAHHGIEIEIIDAISSVADLKFKYQQMPRMRMIQIFDANQSDGVLTQHPNVSNIGCATDWYLVHQNMAFSLKTNQFKINDLSGLKGKAVVSFDGASKYLGPAFKAAVKDTLRYTESAQQSMHISLIYSKRFDVVVGDHLILKLAQKELHTETKRYQPLAEHAILPISFYVARFHRQQTCDKFNAALKHIRDNGTYKSIIDKHLKDMTFVFDHPAEHP